MPVKENQPTLLSDIRQLFQHAAHATTSGLVRHRVQVVGDEAQWPQPQTAQTLELGHGRMEQRRLSVLSLCEVPTAAIEWPGAAQVFRVERIVQEKKSGRGRQETVYGITSLSAQQANAETLLAVVRGHWRIENGLHWVRDVTFDEDRSCVRCGSLPQVMAALRNTVIGLLRASGSTNIAASCRYYAARPQEALALLVT
jgi:predicted transposase YbfD/YdcC